MTTQGLTPEQLLGSADQTLTQVERALDFVNAGLALALGAHEIDPLADSINREQLEALGEHMASIAEKLRTGVITIGPVIGLDIAAIEPEASDQNSTTQDPGLPAGSSGALPAGDTNPDTTQSQPQDTDKGSESRKRRRSQHTVTDADRDGSPSNTLRVSTELPANGLPDGLTPLRIDPKTSTLRINGESLILDRTYEHLLMNALLVRGDQFFARGDLADMYGSEGTPKNFSSQLRSLEQVFKDEFGVDLTQTNGSNGAGLKYRLNPELFPVDHDTFESHIAPKA